MKLIFFLHINIKGSFRLILSFQVCVSRHAQVTQNNKFAISLQYLKTGVSDEVNVLHADKHDSLLQIDMTILMGMVMHSQSFQNSKFAMCQQYVKKEVRDKVDFLHADKHQSFLQGDFNTFGIKVYCKVILSLLVGMIRDSQITQSSKFTMSLQCLKIEVTK